MAPREPRMQPGGASPMKASSAKVVQQQAQKKAAAEKKKAQEQAAAKAAARKKQAEAAKKKPSQQLVTKKQPTSSIKPVKGQVWNDKLAAFTGKAAKATGSVARFSDKVQKAVPDAAKAVTQATAQATKVANKLGVSSKVTDKLANFSDKIVASSGKVGNVAGALAGAGNLGAAISKLPDATQKFVNGIQSGNLQEIIVAFIQAGGVIRQVHQEALKIIDDIKKPDEPLWKHLHWETVQQGAANRTLKPHTINQRSLSTCGPASVMDAIAHLEPDKYAQLVRDIFDTGRVNGKLATKTLRESKPPPRLEQSDWMVMSVLRNTRNELMDYKGQPEEQLQAISLPEDIQSWMKDIAGYADAKVFSTLSPELPGAAAEALDLFSSTGPFAEMFRGKLLDKKKVEQAQKAVKEGQDAAGKLQSAFESTAAIEISELMQAHGDDIVVALLVDADRFMGDPGIVLPYPNHWVRLLSPVEFKKDGAHAQIFTWGYKTKSITPNKLGFRFQDTCFVMVVGARQPGLLSGLQAIELPNLMV